MAHYTGLKNLQNRVHKSGFDLSAKNCFTAKVGELLPVWSHFALPNSSFKFSLDYFTRTRPVQTSAYTRIREYFDFYAVPCNLIWKSFDSAVIQMGEKSPLQSKDFLTSLTVKGDLPYCSLNDLSDAVYLSAGNSLLGSSVSVPSGYGNIFGYNRGDVNHKLLSMLDYGNIVSPSNSSVGTAQNRWWNMQAPLNPVSTEYSQKYKQNIAVELMTLAAYQKIYQDFFRWSQWERADPTAYNFDWFTGSGSLFGSSGIRSSIPPANNYWKRDNLFSLRYCNWNKDKFMGILPNSQFGDLAVLDIPSTGALYRTTGTDTASRIAIGDSANPVNAGNFYIKAPAAAGEGDAINVRASGELSILALRQAEALQKWKEITQSVDTNYREQIKAHFGINVPQSESHMAKYIGGVARNLDISEVINQQLSSADDQAYIYGKGVGSGHGEMTFNTGSGYYILMCIYHAVPLLDYNLSAPDGQRMVTSVEDLPIPEFDSIGMEGVPYLELFNSNLGNFSSISPTGFCGYNPRYYNWKTKIDRVHGAFTTSLSDWVSPIDDAYLAKYSTSSLGVMWQFFKVNPNTLDNIFAVKADSTWETDQLLVNANVGCYATEPLSSDGLPY